MARRVENANQPNPTHPTTGCNHPSYTQQHTSLIVQYLEGKPGGSPPVSCRCIFYRAFRGLQHALADIYLYIFWCFFGSDFFISSHRCLLSVFTLFIFPWVVRVEREYLTGPIRYPHTLFVSFVRQPFSALRSPCTHTIVYQSGHCISSPFLCATITHFALTPGK